MGTIKCKECNKEYDIVLSSCGTGYSWSLFKCPYCKQLCAVKKGNNGFFPKEILNDKEITIEKN